MSVVKPTKSLAVVPALVVALTTYVTEPRLVTVGDDPNTGALAVSVDIKPVVASTPIVSTEVTDDDAEASLDNWIIAGLGEEPDAVAEDESVRIPVQWEAGRGFVKRG